MSLSRGVQSFVTGVVTVVKGFYCENLYDRFLVVPGGYRNFVSSYLLCESCTVWLTIGAFTVEDI